MNPLDALSASFTTGLPYEIVGLLYFAMALVMGRGRNAGRFTPRSRILTVLAAIAMVGCVPFGYGADPRGVLVMLVLAVAAFISTLVDTRRPKRGR